jgi:hypothetical protein
MFRVPGALALGVTALAALLASLLSRRAPGPGPGAVVRFRPPADWEWLPAPVSHGRDSRQPSRPRRLCLRAGWCLGDRLAVLEWRFPEEGTEGRTVVALLGSGDLDAHAWRRLRVCLAHARRSCGPCAAPERDL